MATVGIMTAGHQESDRGEGKDFAGIAEYAMNEVDHNPEAILRLCAAATPAPWYPLVYAKQTGINLGALKLYLEELWLDGLIHKSPGTAETGPAISLTPEGERVLLDPEALERLRHGQPLSPGDRGAIARQVFRGRLRPSVTRLLVLLNILVFAVGYYQARRLAVGNDFLGGVQRGAVKEILNRSGSVSALGILDGQWWRLLTAGFVHIGFLHLLMNMAFLYMAGRTIEKMWGHFRYLVIYLFAVLGGSCLAVSHNVGGGAGASGAVCGLLGAEAIWFICNRKYLPMALLRQARFSLIASFVLLVFIGRFKNVSNWGHIGGAIAGMLAAVLLHAQRFGPAGWRWLALLGFAPLTWYGYHAIDRARATDATWLQVEESHFLARYSPDIEKIAEEASRIHDDEILPVLETHPKRRDASKVESVLTQIAAQERELNDLADRLARAGPYRGPGTEKARVVGRQYILSLAELYATCDRVLRLGVKRTDKDRRAPGRQGREVLENRQAWEEELAKFKKERP